MPWVISTIMNLQVTLTWLKDLSMKAGNPDWTKGPICAHVATLCQSKDTGAGDKPGQQAKTELLGTFNFNWYLYNCSPNNRLVTMEHNSKLTYDGIGINL